MDDTTRRPEPLGARRVSWRPVRWATRALLVAAALVACGEEGSEAAPPAAPGAAPTPGVATDEGVSTTLARLPVDFETAASLRGTGAVQARVADGRLIVEGRFQGLESVVVGADLRRAIPGLRGPAVAPLEISAEGEGMAGAVRGAVQLDEALREALAAGELYVQIHSEQNPEGVLRGWLPAVP